MSTPSANMLGAYGEWARRLRGGGIGMGMGMGMGGAGDHALPRGSFRRPEFRDFERWQAEFRTQAEALFLAPAVGFVPQPRVRARVESEGLIRELLEWKLPYGPPTEAILVKPAGAVGRLPAILALHDHAGDKAFGAVKVAAFYKELHTCMIRHQNCYYGGVSWANAMAKRGFVVLAHDVFGFASRRVRLADFPDAASEALGFTEPDVVGEEEPISRTDQWSDPDRMDHASQAAVTEYNRFAGLHEHVIAKSLFCAGTTYPGVVLAEDRAALDYLASREDVDPGRMGCAGLSGGGLRACYLGGLDPRIACVCCAGMMTTWDDFLLNKSYAHTWMIYVPGLPRLLDYPEMLTLRMPKPTLVIHCRDDQLFTWSEMQRASSMIAEAYHKAGASERFRSVDYPGDHRFDLAMQDEAFAWMSRWLA